MSRQANVHCEPPLARWPDAGVYQLHIRVARDLCITVGRLGRLRIPAGRYCYTGRAARGLRARVRRHVSGARRRRWHIDYLLANHDCHVERVTLAAGEPKHECAANQAVGRDATCPAPGFGSSDCRHGCAAHLWRLD